MLTKTSPTRARVREQVRASTDDAEERQRAKRPSRVREVRASMPPRDDAEERLLDKNEIVAATGKSFVTIWSWMRAAKFPAARDVNGKPMWLASEIDAWMRALPVKRYKKGDAP